MPCIQPSSNECWFSAASKAEARQLHADYSAWD